MRLYHDNNKIFIDLFNWEYRINIELKFCCHGHSHIYKVLINWLEYCKNVRQDVSPEEIIKQYEDIRYRTWNNKKVGDENE